MTWTPRWVRLSAYSLLGIGLAVAATKPSPRKPRAATPLPASTASASLVAHTIRGVVRAATYNIRVKRMGLALSDKPAKPEIDERSLQEWVDYGSRELDAYMTKHARFEEWCRAHPIEETDVDAS